MTNIEAFQSLLKKLGMEKVVDIRRSTNKQVIAIIEPFPDLSAMELREILRIAGEKMGDRNYYEDLQRRIKPRRFWYLIGYLLGGSLRNIATLDGVQPQTVLNGLNTLMDSVTRNAKRMAKSTSLEALSEYKVTFNKHIELLMKLEPLEAARWIVNNTDRDI